MKSNRSNHYPLAAWLVSMILVLFLTDSGRANAQSLTTSQQSVVNNLSASSYDLKSQITLGLRSSTNLGIASGNGYIVDPNAWTSAAITEQQRANYNLALSTFQTTSFYNAQQFFSDQAAANRAQMQQSIGQLATAAVDLQKVVQVNQLLQSVTDAPSAKATQTAIASSGLSTEVTGQQVAAFNTSLANVNDYASKAATFLSAANNVTITSTVDLAAANYNKTLYNASAAYSYSNDIFNVAFEGGGGVGFQGFFTDRQVSASQFFTQPQIYGGQ